MDDQTTNDDAQVTPQDDQTASEPQVDTTVPADAEPASQPTVEPDATADRFKQDNAQMRATLIKLGVDPDSTDADNIRSGAIDPKEYMAAKYGTAPVQPQPSAEPEQSAEEILGQIDSMINSVDGQVSVDQYQKIERLKLDLNKKLLAENKALKQQNQQDQTQRVLDNCMNACRTTYQSDNVFRGLPTEVQQQAAKFIESRTDVAMGQVAQQVGFENAAQPQVYQNETTKVLQEFHGLVQALSGKAPQPKPTPQNVAPVVPMGSGPAQPITTPRPVMRLDDLESNAAKYLATQAGQI